MRIPSRAEVKLSLQFRDSGESQKALVKTGSLCFRRTSPPEEPEDPLLAVTPTQMVEWKYLKYFSIIRNFVAIKLTIM